MTTFGRPKGAPRLNSWPQWALALIVVLSLSSPAWAAWERTQQSAEWLPRAFHTITSIDDASGILLLGGIKSEEDDLSLDGWYSMDLDMWSIHNQASTVLDAPPPCGLYRVLNYHRWGSDQYVLGGGTCFERGCCVTDDLAECRDFEGGCEWWRYPFLPWSPRVGHVTIGPDNGGKFISIGGLFPGDPLDSPVPEARRYFNEVWVYDLGTPVNEQQSEPMLAPWAGRYGHSCVAVGDTLVLAGGYVEDAGPLGEKAANDVWTSGDEGMTWALANAAAPWPARGFHGCAAVGGRVWIAGGRDEADNDFADTWYSDDLGVTWQQYRAQAAWTPRHGLAIASIHGALWLTGGRTSQGEYFNDVWRLNTTLSPNHTADQDTNGQFSLSEVLRAVQFFNIGELHCEEGTEDGYAPGPGDQTCAPHAADYNPPDWKISLSELLRLIQLYNVGGYAPCETGEDGFCPAGG